MSDRIFERFCAFGDQYAIHAEKYNAFREANNWQGMRSAINDMTDFHNLQIEAWDSFIDGWPHYRYRSAWSAMYCTRCLWLHAVRKELGMSERDIKVPKYH